MKTVGYLNAHVKKISHLNVLRTIAKFHKPDIEKNLVTHYLLSQYGMKKGIKMFDECGVRAVHKELDQLLYRKLIQPRLHRELTSEQKRRSLSYLIFIKEKRDLSIRGRRCADVRPQRLCMQK